LVFVNRDEELRVLLQGLLVLVANEAIDRPAFVIEQLTLVEWVQVIGQKLMEVRLSEFLVAVRSHSEELLMGAGVAESTGHSDSPWS
jgi:hypothetical protein